MKVEVKKILLISAIKNAKTVANPNIFISGKNNSLQVAGFNIDARIETTITAKVIEPGEIVFSCAKIPIQESISAMKGQTILIETFEKSIKFTDRDSTGHKNFSVPSGVKAELPELPELELPEGEETILPASFFVTVLTKILTTAKRDREVPYGLLLQKYSNKLRFVTTNGFALTNVESNFDYTIDHDVIIPIPLVEILKVMAKNYEVVKFVSCPVLGRILIQLVSHDNSVAIVASINLSNMPDALNDYLKITYQDTNVATVSVKKLFEAARKLKVFVKKIPNDSAKIKFEEGKVILSASNHEIEAELTVPCKVDWLGEKDSEVFLNIKHLISIIGSMNKESKVKLNFIDKKNPVVIKETTNWVEPDFDAYNLVMPMNK